MIKSVCINCLDLDQDNAMKTADFTYYRTPIGTCSFERKPLSAISEKRVNIGE